MAEEEQKCKCPAGIPAWVMTFADLMSLLMCFFVLLLSFSEMDVQKFKQIAGSLKFAFGVQRDIKVEEPPKGVNIVAKEFSPAPPQPTPINDVRQVTTQDTQQELKLIDKIEKLQEQQEEIEDVMGKMSEADAEAEGLKEKLEELQAEEAELKEELEKIQGKIDNLQKKEIQEETQVLQKALKQEIDDELVEVIANNASITIRIRESGSFPSGSDELEPDFIDVLHRVRDLLVDSPGRIIVAGHTDSIPIETARFRSNWDLSTERAVSVVHELLFEDKIESSRLSAQGFGDSRPLADNETPEGRSQNRRVEIIISKGKDELKGSVADEDGGTEEGDGSGVELPSDPRTENQGRAPSDLDSPSDGSFEDGDGTIDEDDGQSPLLPIFNDFGQQDGAVDDGPSVSGGVVDATSDNEPSIIQQELEASEGEDDGDTSPEETPSFINF